MNKISSNSQGSPVVAILDRYNLVSFIVIVAAGLAVSVMILNNILVRSFDSINNNRETTNIVADTPIDQATVNQLLKLEKSDNNVNYKILPVGRNNPFSE